MGIRSPLSAAAHTTLHTSNMTIMKLMRITLLLIASSLDSCEGVSRFTSGGGKKVEYSRNYPLSGSPNYDRALIVIHGYGRNSEEYYDSVIEAQNIFPGVGTDTLVLAPLFKSSDDNWLSDELYWSKGGWSKGEDSLDGQGFSSFSVVDGLLNSISSRFPNVTDIVIAGHSAGAQFVQRYAGIGDIPDIRCDIRIRYVAANPGSYMFPTANRPQSTSGCDNGGQGQYTMGETGVDACPSGTSVITDPVQCSAAAVYVDIPYNSYTGDLVEDITGECVVKNVGKSSIRTTVTNKHGNAAAWLCKDGGASTYDNYKYGISNLPDALNYASISITEIQKNLVERDVILLLGTEDNSRVDIPRPDQSCEADSQGLHRFERGINYKNNVKALDCNARTSIIKVPGVEHDHNAMFTAPQGIMALFI